MACVRCCFPLSSLLGSVISLLLSVPLLFCALLQSGGRGDEDAANDPIGTADRKRTK